MANASLRRLWKDVDSELRAAISILKDINAKAELGDAEDFLAHNELLLACEAIECGIEYQSLSTSEPVQKHLKNARRLMCEEQNS